MGWLHFRKSSICHWDGQAASQGGAGYNLAGGVAFIVLMTRRIIVKAEILPGGDPESEARLQHTIGEKGESKPPRTRSQLPLRSWYEASLRRAGHCAR